MQICRNDLLNFGRMHFFLPGDRMSLDLTTDTVVKEARFDRHFVRDMTWSRHQLAELAERRFEAASVRRLRTPLCMAYRSIVVLCCVLVAGVCSMPDYLVCDAFCFVGVVVRVHGCCQAGCGSVARLERKRKRKALVACRSVTGGRIMLQARLRRKTSVRSASSSKRYARAFNCCIAVPLCCFAACALLLSLLCLAKR